MLANTPDHFCYDDILILLVSLGSSVTTVISHKKMAYIGPIHFQFSSSLPVTGDT